MVISIHQPAYLPWLGYFDKIIRSDTFVYLDTVQFEKNSFINRNQVKTANGSTWLTIPVKLKGHTKSTLQDTLIDNSQNWSEKHLKTIYLSYKKAPRFEQCYPKLEALYQDTEDLLSELCFRQLQFWCEEFGISTKIVRASELEINSSKSELVLNICQYLGAEKYISGALGKDYLNEAAFEQNKIALEYQDYQHPSYAQLYGEFLSHLSIIDFWMNCGNRSLICGEE